MSGERAYGSGLVRSRTAPRRGDLAAVLQISEEGVGQIVDAKLIAIERIHPNPDQPRRAFDDASLRELAASIRARGVLQPIRVRRHDDDFQIVAGERRYRAALLAGLRELPAIVVEQADDQAYLDSLIENVQREDLNPIDRAQALKQLRVNLGLQSWEAVGAALGLSRQSVYNLLNLTDLPETIQHDLRSGDLTEKHGRALRQLNGRPELQADAYRTIVRDGLSGDQSLALVRTLRHRPVAAPDRERSPEPAGPGATEAPRVLDDLARLVARLETTLPALLTADDRRAVRAPLERAIDRLTALLARLAE